MSEWRGLHNPERHRVEASGLTSCRNCADTGCSRVCPCWCCLQAEVERLTDALHESEMAREELRKALADRDRRIAEALALCYTPFDADIVEILQGESNE